MVNQKIRESAKDRVFLIFIYVILTLVLLIVGYPLLHIVSASISNYQAVIAGKVTFFPIKPTFIAYKEIFESDQILTGYANSLFYTLFGTLLQVTLTVFLAYPLSRKEMYGRGILMAIIVFTMFFSGGLIPTYLVVKSLGILDTRWAMILPQAVMVFQVIIARTFFQVSIPQELYEAAQLDGCSELRTFWTLVVPLSKPIIAVLVLMYAVYNWNAYFEALIYLSSKSKFPLQLVLRSILILNQPREMVTMDASRMMKLQEIAELLKYALIVVASLPVMIVYPFIQKHFVKGVMIGSLKG